MRLRTLALTTLIAVTAAGSIAPAFADEDWRWHERHEREEWRERAWRQHEWRERAWREHEWREHAYGPPVVASPPYGYYSPPPVYYGNPGYYR